MKHIYVTPSTEVPAHKRDGSQEFPFKTMEEAHLGGVPDPRGERVRAVMQWVMGAWEPIPLDATLGDLGMTGAQRIKTEAAVAKAFGLPSHLTLMLTLLGDDTGQTILDYLADKLGPSLPDKDGYLELTLDQFDNRYHPEEHDDGSTYIQREWAADDELIQEAAAKNCCWAAVDGDDGDFCIEWGNRTLNRIFNIITLNPIEDESWHVVASDPDDGEGEE